VTLTAVQTRPRAPMWIAVTIFTLTVSLFVAEIVLGLLTRDLPSSSSWSSAGTVGGISLSLVLFSPPVVGLLITWRRAGNAIGWLLLAIGLAWGLADSSTYSDYGVRLHPGSLPAAALPGAIGNALWLPAIGLTGTFLILLFPDGHLPGRRWRWVAYASALVMCVGTLGLTFTPGDMADAGYPGTTNPIGIDALGGVLRSVQYVIVLLPPAIAASAAGMIVRYRRSRGVERLQLRWLTAVAGAVAVIYATVFALSVLVAPNSNAPPAWLAAAQAIGLMSTCLIPIAIGFAVLRYRLYDIDVIIRRTLVYTALLASLAAVYVGGVAVLGMTFRAVTGLSSSLAVTVSTLAVAAAFQPLRRRIRRAVDRRFYRAAYDAQAAVDAFSGQLRQQIDLDVLADRLLATVRETVRPRSASVWLASVTIPERPSGTKGA
jgi:hypothetical protein